MKRFAPLLLALAFIGCGVPPTPVLVPLPDNRTGVAFRAVSWPFAVSRGETEEQVVRQHVRDTPGSLRACPGDFDIVQMRRADPNNFSLIIVDAVVVCK
jgi:hypothetical protein